MSDRSRTKWGTVISLSLILTSIIALVVLIPQLVSIVVALTTPALSATPIESADAAVATPGPALIQARAILARLRDEIVPREGQATQYSVIFSDAGYRTLIEWNADFKVTERYANIFESLDLRLPCCEWSTPSRDEKTNCACGHHQALEGLSKKLLSDGRGRDAAQREVILWNRYLFPKEALRTEMEKRAQFDSAMKTALEELKAHGEC